jgi:leucyl aminopeptidase (aminopeptidase T)
VHIVGTSRRALIGSLVTNPQRIFDLLTALRNTLRPQSRLHVRTPAGTQLEVEMAPHLRWYAMGSPLARGQWLNVPYGALVSSPASVTGTYVVDASMGGGLGSKLGALSNRPIRILFDGGKVKAVDCRDATLESYVKKFLGDGMGHDRVGLIRLGANIGVAAPLGEFLYDEVMPGVHLSLGDPLAPRTGAHWSSHGQLPFAIADADVDLDGEPLIRHGRYVRLV